jgi:hypothetical protein
MPSLALSGKSFVAAFGRDVPPCRLGVRPNRPEGRLGEGPVQMVLPDTPAGLPAVGALSQSE